METSEENGAVRHYDDQPIKGATKTFEQLLEEQLANEQLENGQNDTHAKKPLVKFLKRGEGLSRFNLKENITPQKDWKPCTKARQPLVDYSKPVLKPKAKEPCPPEGRRKSTTKQAPKVLKPTVPTVSRKVANLGSRSPTKTLQRSNTMPARKPDQKPTIPQRKAPVEQPQSATNSVKQKSPLSVTTSARTIKSVTNAVQVGSVSPRKHNLPVTTRPSSALEMQTSHIAKPTSPRKKSSLSPKKQLTSMSPDKVLAQRLISAGAAGGSPIGTAKKPVDSSFYSNIHHRVQNEEVETEELQVGHVITCARLPV